MTKKSMFSEYFEEYPNLEKEINEVKNNLEGFIYLASNMQNILFKLRDFLEPLGLYYEFKNKLNQLEISALNHIEGSRKREGVERHD
jgi:hypothetical protein